MTTIPQRVHPCVRRFFELAGLGSLTLAAVADGAGLTTDTMRSWRTRYAPGLPTLDAALNVIGYELAVVPKGMRDKLQKQAPNKARPYQGATRHERHRRVGA